LCRRRACEASASPNLCAVRNEKASIISHPHEDPICGD
jgi:hypothetical protein